MTVVRTAAPRTHRATHAPIPPSGVATVVLKLFNIVQPTAAYFGQKDGLQCLVVRKVRRRRRCR